MKICEKIRKAWFASCLKQEKLCNVNVKRMVTYVKEDLGRKLQDDFGRPFRIPNCVSAKKKPP